MYLHVETRYYTLYIIIVAFYCTEHCSIPIEAIMSLKIIQFIIIYGIVDERSYIHVYVQEYKLAHNNCMSIITSHLRLFRKSGTTDRIAAKDSCNIRHKIREIK